MFARASRSPPAGSMALGRAHLPETLHRLDLGGRISDGAGRLRRRLRPALSTRDPAQRRHRLRGWRGRARGLTRPAVKTLRWSIPLAIVAILLAFLWVCLRSHRAAVPSSLVATPAAEFVL